ncbi:MAG: hypothetical protein GTO24_05410 [candidate division Zixibacteria bacterium]|nr:hypothetical protein [candidate division Zixibacteria bacterium]
MRAARYLARKGVCGSFYLLHTAPYYGDFHEGTFTRNPMMAELVLRFIVSGCELGLHTDPFWVYTVHNMDGAEAVKQELTWLRSLGAVIRGTVAHNSAPVYGCENYEVFEERVLWHRQVRSPSGKILPLGKLSERELKLSYEGNFTIRKKDIKVQDAVEFCSNVTGKETYRVLREGGKLMVRMSDRGESSINEVLTSADVRSKAWMRRYLVDNPCCDRTIDYQFWLIGRDKWVVAGKQKGQYLFEWEIDIDRLLDLIQNLPENTRSVLVIHPDYFEP